jgi:hypothetical protein
LRKPGRDAVWFPDHFLGEMRRTWQCRPPCKLLSIWEQGARFRTFSDILGPTVIPKQQKDNRTMPATKDNNNDDPAHPAKPSRKEQGEGALPGTEGERWKAARTLREITRAAQQPAPPTCYDEWDEEMALDFLIRYQDLEQALVQAGFTKGSQTPGLLLPNWEQFALHIEEQFDPDSEPVLQGAVAYLYWHQENLDRRNARIDNAATWATYDVDNDMVWLAELIQRVAHQRSDEISHMDRQPCDDTQVSAALFVLMAWAELDPEVARWLEDRKTLM